MAERGFGTKAETLARLGPLLTSALTLPMRYFTLEKWGQDREGLLDLVLAEPWADGTLMARSSAVIEDTATSSQAGRFRSLPGLRGRGPLAWGIDSVFASYDTERPDDQVLVQPQISDARASGVACTRDPSSGAPYLVVNWVDGPATDAVTGGRVGDLRTWYGAAHVAHPDLSPPPAAVRALLRELQELTGEPSLEAEFAVTADETLVLLQARPLVVPGVLVSDAHHRATLDRVDREIDDGVRARRGAVLGGGTVFGVMPDWNPAEIIGIRPRPLALSMYRHLITDEVWSAARHRYGYRDLRGVPLLRDFCGLPYVDVRASFSSLLPRGLPDALGGRLVDHWVNTLVGGPHLHDKVESAIVVSSLGLRSPGRVDTLTDHGFTAAERDTFARCLRELTDDLVGGPLWKQDLDALRLLGSRSDGRPAGSCADTLRADLDLCVRHGTLPFAGLARAAFVATELLDDLVAEGVFTPEDRRAFLAGLTTVASELRHDFATLDKTTFLKRYGHLRPGTYDILSSRYDEEPDRYFGWAEPRPPAPETEPFIPGRRRLSAVDRLIGRAGFTFDARRLLTFVAEAIRGRERAKFEFTAVLSDVLTGMRALGERLGCDADDMSYVSVDTVLGLGSGSDDARPLREAVERGREAHAVTRTVILPPLVTGPHDAWRFELSGGRPNFITQGRVLAPVSDIDAGDPPQGAIALVTRADPGYDWLFSKGIVGLVTAFGGVNSHMAVRALEFGIPAVIGVGEPLFRSWLGARALDIDAASGLVGVHT